MTSPRIRKHLATTPTLNRPLQIKKLFIHFNWICMQPKNEWNAPVVIFDYFNSVPAVFLRSIDATEIFLSLATSEEHGRQHLTVLLDQQTQRLRIVQLRHGLDVQVKVTFRFDALFTANIKLLVLISADVQLHLTYIPISLLEILDLSWTMSLTFSYSAPYFFIKLLTTRVLYLS